MRNPLPLVKFLPAKEFNTQQTFEFVAFASIPTCMSGRTFFGAPFASLEKYASHFSNSAYGGTEPNEAPPKVLVEIRTSDYASIFQNIFAKM